jgi:hypothetical protein
VVIEAGAVAGYVIAWAVRKARRAVGRLDNEADAVIDAGLDRLHEMVAARLADHPVIAELVEEAEHAALNDVKVSEVTRQQVELALAAAAREDEAFGRAVTELAAWLGEVRQAVGQATSRQGAAVFTGDARVEANRGGIAFGQVAGDVHIAQEPGNPPQPGRFGHRPYPASRPLRGAGPRGRSRRPK